MIVASKQNKLLSIIAYCSLLTLVFIMSINGLSCENIWENKDSSIFTNVVSLFSGFWFTYGIIPTAICGYFGFFKESKQQEAMRKGFFGCLVVWAVCFIGGAFVYQSIITFVKTMIGVS